jgi:hypothetical protein
MAMLHDLKCWPEFFEAIFDGRKNFEVRKDDRKFRVGDLLLLREWSPNRLYGGGSYSGRTLQRRVTYVMHGMGNVGVIGPQRGVSLGFVVLGLADSPAAEATLDLARDPDRAKPRDDGGAPSQLSWL